MATAQSIIHRALRLIGAIATGETPEAAESFDALQTINGMLSTWRNENLIAWTVQEIVAPITGGKQGYTMGTGGDKH